MRGSLYFPGLHFLEIIKNILRKKSGQSGASKLKELVQVKPITISITLHLSMKSDFFYCSVLFLDNILAESESPRHVGQSFALDYKTSCFPTAPNIQQGNLMYVRLI